MFILFVVMLTLELGSDSSFPWWAWVLGLGLLFVEMWALWSDERSIEKIDRKIDAISKKLDFH